MVYWDPVLTDKPQGQHLERLLDSICSCVRKNEFNTWKEVSGVRFALHLREVDVTPPPHHQRSSVISVGTTPTKLSQENTDIIATFDPFGNKELQKIMRMIKEAADQSPKVARGIVMLDTFHPKRIVSITEEKLSQSRYEQIITIPLTSNGA